MDETSKNFWMGAAIGAVIIIIIDLLVPFMGPLVGGFVAGYIAKGDHLNGEACLCDVLRQWLNGYVVHTACSCA